MAGSMFASMQVDSDFGDKASTQWWRPNLPDTDCHTRLSAAIKRIKNAQLTTKAEDLKHLRFYGGAPVLGFGVSTYTKVTQLSGSRIGLNISRSCSDALTAKLMSDEMKPRLVTNGADWDTQQKAIELEKYLNGQCESLDVNEKLAWMVLNACIFGTGILRPYIDGKGKDKRICIDTVPKTSVWIDDQEALYGRPPTFYQRMWYDRSQLAAMFSAMMPKNSKAQQLIARAKTQSDEDLDAIGYQATADQILVTEAWRVPTRKGGTDGRHAMMLENGLLYQESYEYDEPPFIFYTLWPQPLGFWGAGIVQQVQSLQIELNVLMQKIQRSFHLLGSGHVLLDRGSKMNKHKIDNEIGSIWEYVGNEPKIVATNPVPPQIFEHLDRIYTRAFELSGISQLEAQSLKPKGLNSGVALDAYLDITTERFNVTQRRLQRCFVKLCKWILRLSVEIAQTNPDYGLLSADKSHADVVHFKKNYLEENQYVMRLYATNKLSDDPSERLEQIERMMNAGGMSMVTGQRLMAGTLDLEEEYDLTLSGYNAVEFCISKALKEGKYVGPEAWMPIGTQDQPGPAIPQVTNAMMNAWRRGAPEAKLKLLKDWIADAVALQGRISPPMAAAPVANDATNPFAAKVQSDVAGQAASNAAQGLVAS